MKDLAFLMTVLIVLAFGFPLTGKLDRFFNHIKTRRSEPLQIAIESASLFSLISEIQQGSSAQGCGAAQVFFCESREQMLQDLSAHQIDIAIVYGNQAVPLGYRRHVFCVEPISPVEADPSTAKARNFEFIWKMSLSTKPEVREFMQHVTERLHDMMLEAKESHRAITTMMGHHVQQGQGCYGALIK